MPENKHEIFTFQEYLIVMIVAFRTLCALLNIRHKETGIHDLL